MKQLILLISLSLFFTTPSAHAVTVNIDVDINTHANYSACDQFAKRIRELASDYVNSHDADTKARLVERIKKKKKKLKRCEKKERSLVKRAVHALSGGSVTVGASF